MLKKLINVSAILSVIIMSSCNLQRKYYVAYTYQGNEGPVSVYDYYYVDPREEKKENPPAIIIESTNNGSNCSCGKCTK